MIQDRHLHEDFRHGKTADGGRKPSPGIWQNCPVAEFQINPTQGFHLFEDFTDGVAIAANTAVAAANALGTTGRWTGCTAATAGTTISTLATNYQGIAHLESTTDNEDCILAYPKNAHTHGIFKFTANKRLWMEARVSLLNVTNSKFNAFFGFAEEGLVATTTLITASDAMADKDYVGFQRIFADGDQLDVVYNTESGSTSPVAHTSDLCLVAADTFLKIGMYCDGKYVYFYRNGVRIGTGLALTATDFPDGQEMAFYAGLMLGHADTASIELDWVKLAQEY